MCCGVHFITCRPSRKMHTLFLATLINFKTRPQSCTETSADLSTEFAELYDVKFPAVLRFFSSISSSYIACPLPNFSRSRRPNAWSAQECHSQTKPGSSKFAKLCKTERLEHAGVFTPKLNMALPNLPSSPTPNAWRAHEFSLPD